MVKCSFPVENAEFQWCTTPAYSHVTCWYLQPCEWWVITGNFLAKEVKPKAGLKNNFTMLLVSSATRTVLFCVC